MKKICLIVLCAASLVARSQDNLDSLMNAGGKATEKEYVNNAFKSSRVIMGHSMEMLGSGVLDFRILHRFGTVKNGLSDMFGLDDATMRMGFDYGLTRNLTIGVGRSTRLKELDAFAKYRIVQQSTGKKSSKFSLLAAAGITCYTGKWADEARKNYFSSRLAYYGQLIVGRKFSENFTLQLAPTFVHRNLVQFNSDENDMVAIGIGSRLKLSKRTALVLDAFPQVFGTREDYHQVPISIGVDIETGGHVFQLHFSNATGMNEKAFITETTQKWSKSEFQFGFNLSRVFTIKKNTAANW
jgi:hypothetical protein